MRITDIYISGYGPFQGNKLRHFNTDDERVLFLGLSGSGKTTVLRAVGLMWLELGRYLAGKAPVYQGHGAMAMALRLENSHAIITIGGGVVQAQAMANHQDAWHLRSDRAGFSASSGNPPTFSNICLMDGDSMDDTRSHAPWLITDIDAGRLGRMDKEAAVRLAKAVSGVLIGKKLAADEEGRLSVALPNGSAHALSGLSKGERRVLSLCYLACAGLQEGGVLLLDEPDVHLHPSQMLGLITTLENAALSRGGQMIIASHRHAIWNRYELLGKVIAMEGANETIG